MKDSRIRERINKSKSKIAPFPPAPTLHFLTQKGHLSILKSLSRIELQSYVVSELDLRLIHLASEFGHLDIVKFFVEENIFKADHEGKHKLTPLHYAAGMGHVHVFKYLVKECKCDPKCKVSNDYQKYTGGGTPLHFAAIGGHLSIVKHILEFGYGIDAEIELTLV